MSSLLMVCFLACPNRGNAQAIVAKGSFSGLFPDYRASAYSFVLFSFNRLLS